MGTLSTRLLRDGRRAWQAYRRPEFVRVAEAVEPVQPGSPARPRAVTPRIRRGPGLEFGQDLAEQGGLSGTRVRGPSNYRLRVCSQSLAQARRRPHRDGSPA